MFVCPCVLSILSLSLAAPGSTNSPQSKEREESRTNKVGLSIEKLFHFSVARHKSCCPLLLSLYKWVSAKNKKESGKKKTKKIVIISDVNIFIVQAYSVHTFYMKWYQRPSSDYVIQKISLRIFELLLLRNAVPGLKSSAFCLTSVMLPRCPRRR